MIAVEGTLSIESPVNMHCVFIILELSLIYSRAPIYSSIQCNYTNQLPIVIKSKSYLRITISHQSLAVLSTILWPCNLGFHVNLD
jgi:hypothetical protein